MRQKKIMVFILLFLFMMVSASVAEMKKAESEMTKAAAPLSLITATPEEGFALAVKLARMGVKTTQPDKEVLFMLRDVYSKDPDALIACSQVIATHFQTVAAANNYWR